MPISWSEEVYGRLQGLWKCPGRDAEKELILEEWNKAREFEAKPRILASQLNTITGKISPWLL